MFGWNYCCIESSIISTHFRSEKQTEMMFNLKRIFFLFYFISHIIIAAEWHEMGQTEAPMFDVGFNSYNTSFSSEFTSQASNVVDSTDLGAHWVILSDSNDGSMDLGVSSLSAQKAVITSILGRGIYTLDGGTTWKNTVGFVGGMQGLSRTKDKSNIYGGADNIKVRTSKDFGATWDEVPIGNLSFGGRYIAMPTNLTWYVTAGAWIEQQTYDITSKIKYNVDTKQIEYYFERETNVYTVYSNKRKLMQPENKMWGAIYKTFDGGKTFTEIFYDEGNFYFNGIDCCDVNNCYAVSEGDSESGSSDPGSRIWNSVDGGKTWNMMFHDKDDGASLLSVRCIGNGQEAFAGGGDIAAGKEFAGYIFHTIDGGKTWSNYTAKGSVFAMDMNDDNSRGIAVGITKLKTGITYGYY
eukprot:288053_1